MTHILCEVLVVQLFISCLLLFSKVRFCFFNVLNCSPNDQCKINLKNKNKEPSMFISGFLYKEFHLSVAFVGVKEKPEVTPMSS